MSTGKLRNLVRFVNVYVSHLRCNLNKLNYKDAWAAEQIVLKGFLRVLHERFNNTDELVSTCISEALMIFRESGRFSSERDEYEAFNYLIMEFYDFPPRRRRTR